MISVTACQSQRQHQQFENVAELLLGREKAFVPPFPGSIAKYLSPKSAFHRCHGEIHPFIATKNGRPVGRIAAIINHTHNAFYNDQVGFFGFFDCENDPATARVLFETAENFLRARGFTKIRGPYNPTINDECGLMVEGFGKPTYIGLIWNPPYYQSLVEAAGFRSVREMYGMSLPLAKLEAPERLIRISGRVAKRSKMILRPINIAQLEEELKIVHEIYNCTLERNWGFIPISMEDLLFAADDMKAIADPQMILIAEQDGQRAGVALSLPNINELLALVKKTPRWLRPLHVLWLMKTRRITTARQIIYGISPRFRDKGLHGWLLYEHFRIAKERYEDAELGWMEETNEEILESSRLMGGIPIRTWRIYEKALT